MIDYASSVLSPAQRNPSMTSVGPLGTFQRVDMGELMVEQSIKCCSTLANACRNLVDRHLGTDPHQFDLYVCETNRWVDGITIPNERERLVRVVLNIGDSEHRSDSCDHRAAYRRFRDVELPAAVEYCKAIKG